MVKPPVHAVHNAATILAVVSWATCQPLQVILLVVLFSGPIIDWGLLFLAGMFWLNPEFYMPGSFEHLKFEICQEQESYLSNACNLTR